MSDTPPMYSKIVFNHNNILLRAFTSDLLKSSSIYRENDHLFILKIKSTYVNASFSETHYLDKKIVLEYWRSKVIFPDCAGERTEEEFEKKFPVSKRIYLMSLFDNNVDHFFEIESKYYFIGLSLILDELFSTVRYVEIPLVHLTSVQQVAQEIEKNDIFEFVSNETSFHLLGISLVAPENNQSYHLIVSFLGKTKDVMVVQDAIKKYFSMKQISLES